MFKWFWLIVLVVFFVLFSYIGVFVMYFLFGCGGEIENVLGVSMFFISGLWGFVLVMSFYIYFFVMMIICLSLFSLDVSLVNVVWILGLLLGVSLWWVVLLRVVNSIVVGVLLVVLYVLFDFGMLVIMGLDIFIRVIFVEYNVFGLS